jgi:hypothetical protein
MALIVLLIPAYSYSSTIGNVHISLIQGDVQINTEDTQDWVAAYINMPLREGDRIWVPEAGRLELTLRDGTNVRLDENSALEFLSTEKDSYQLYLSVGHAYVNYKGLDGYYLQMDTPLSSVRLYDRAKFGINVSDEGFTKISVFNGAVSAESRSGVTRVSAGKTLSIGEEFFAELSSLGPSDEWERWNTQRDNTVYEGRYNRRYLPDELSSYAYDFDTYGRWVYATDYGYVWTPSIYTSTGWAPYRTGRWVWAGGDYVWISYEPWGWVPYHYGRWAYIVSVGWAWVPPVRGSVYWGPGFVGWIYTPTYVAWVPLAPTDIYYGYGYYGPNSINIINVNINNIRDRRRYKNAYFNGGITIVNHDSFVTGRYVHYNMSENPFLGKVVSVGRPAIKHERATTVPILRDIPKTKQPPQLVRDIKVRELKKERPLVKERTYSVLRPESPQKTMAVETVRKPSSSVAGRIPEKSSVLQRPAQVHERKTFESSVQDRQKVIRESVTEKQGKEVYRSREYPVQKQNDKQYQNKYQELNNKENVPPAREPSKVYKKQTQPLLKEQSSEGYRIETQPSVQIKKPAASTTKRYSNQGTKKQNADKGKNAVTTGSKLR